MAGAGTDTFVLNWSKTAEYIKGLSVEGPLSNTLHNWVTSK